MLRVFRELKRGLASSEAAIMEEFQRLSQQLVPCKVPDGWPLPPAAQNNADSDHSDADEDFVAAVRRGVRDGQEDGEEDDEEGDKEGDEDGERRSATVADLASLLWAPATSNFIEEVEVCNRSINRYIQLRSGQGFYPGH